MQQGEDQCLAFESQFWYQYRDEEAKKEGICFPKIDGREDGRYAVSKMLDRRIAGDVFCVRPMLR